MYTKKGEFVRANSGDNSKPLSLLVVLQGYCSYLSVKHQEHVGNARAFSDDGDKVEVHFPAELAYGEGVMVGEWGWIFSGGFDREGFFLAFV